MILTVFSPLNIQSKKETVWEELSPNTSSSQRPLSLQLGKESREAYQSQSLFNDDMRELTTGIAIGEQNFKLDFNLACDRKASDLYLGCGGAYCDLCTVSRSDGQKAPEK